jgi:hypothetical protein
MESNSLSTHYEREMQRMREEFDLKVAAHTAARKLDSESIAEVL